MWLCAGASLYSLYFNTLFIPAKPLLVRIKPWAFIDLLSIPSSSPPNHWAYPNPFKINDWWLYSTKSTVSVHRDKQLISHIRNNINNRSLQCCNSTHVHLSLINHNNMWQEVRQCPHVAAEWYCSADSKQQRRGLTTENFRLGINLASLMASLWAWNILTLFMLDCQYFT